MTAALSLWAAVIHGIVEGLTEFIPVSSTGHLILLESWLGGGGEKAKTFDIFIQLGAILAVVVLYFPRFLALVGIGAGKQPEERSFQGWPGILKLAVACLPVFVCGGLLGKIVKAKLFFPGPVAAALIAGGILLIAVDRAGRKPKVGALGEITLWHCLAVGCFQCLALWPGMSRSGSTIVGAMLLGFERKLAAEFSFFVAVPTMVAAVGYDMLKSMHSLSADDLPVFAVGFAVSFVVGMLAIKFFIGILTRYSLRPFGWYRVALGVLVLALLR